MKFKNDVKLRKLLDQNVVVAFGENRKKSVVVLNETSAFLWRLIEETECDKNRLISELISKYNIDTSQAEKGADKFIKMISDLDYIE